MKGIRSAGCPSGTSDCSSQNPSNPSWHSLSGHLQYKTSEGLSCLFRRRLWFILEESRCRLLGYKSPESYKAKGRKPSVDIDLKTSGVFPNPVKNEEFIIICSDNEHHLSAENHESSVIWLLALQSARNRCQGISVPTLASSMASASSAFHSSEGADSHQPMMMMMINGGVKLPWKSKERSSSMLPFLHSYLSGGHYGTSTLEPLRNMGISLDTGIEFYTTGDKHTGTTSEVNEANDAGDSAFGSDWKSISKSSAPASSSDDTPLVDDPFLGGPCASPSGAQQRDFSESSFELSSQHQDLLNQMMSLEKQVMNSKAMMAKLLNKECCFKEIVEQRDLVIRELLLRIQKLENANLKSNAESFIKSKIEGMQNQMLFQCSEIKHLTRLRQRDIQQVEQQKKTIEEVTTHLGAWKDNYVYLLQSSISVPTGDASDKWELKLYGGDLHKKRVRELLEDARLINPSLPDYGLLLLKMSHIDQYGFKREFEREELLLHYICQQLHQHYRAIYPEQQNYLMMWNEILAGPSLLSFHAIAGMKIMCRQGIPVQYRSEVWKRLVHGKISDLKQEKGANYFGHLMTRAYDSLLSGYYRKQIFVDLLRTMPTNVNFCDPSAEGIRKLKEVLQAFSFHNPAIGYCQGLNFVASMCLLFFDVEDAFWALIAITEKYFDPSYFDKGLTGANVDQEILQEIFAQKLPKLYDHVEKFDLEFSTITINWFLSLFIDVVPFETLLRIWDCFFMEGPKVLFRFSLAILKKHDEMLLDQSDVLGLLKYLKTCTKLLFDVDGLIKTAFEELKPFPRRQQISERRQFFEEVIRCKRSLRKDAPQRKSSGNQSAEENEASPLRYLAVASVSYNSMWVVFTSQELSKVSVYNKNEKKLSSHFQVKSQILCVCAVGDIILISTLSSQIFAYSGRNHGDLLWSYPLTGTCLSMCSRVIPHKTTFSVYAALNNGFVAFYEKIPLTPVAKAVPSFLSEGPLLLPVSNCPITSVLLVDPHVWLACENFIHVIHSETLNLIAKIQISKSSVDFIRTMTLYDPCRMHHQPAANPLAKHVNNTNQKGIHQAGEQTRQNANHLRAVWLSVEGSSVVQMWHATEHHCMAMYDVYKGLHVLQCKEEEYLNVNKIMSLLCLDSTLWVGTRSGFIYIFAVSFSAPHYKLLLKKLESFRQMGKFKNRSYTMPIDRGLKTGTGRHNSYSNADSRNYDFTPFKNRGRIRSTDCETMDSLEESVCEEDEMRKGSLNIGRAHRNNQEFMASLAAEIGASLKIPSREQLPDEKFFMNSCNGCLILEAKFKVSEKPVRCLTLVDSHPANLTVCSCSGNYGDAESVLLWRRDPKDHAWTNEAITEPHQVVHPSQTTHRASLSQMSRSNIGKRLSHLLTGSKSMNGDFSHSK